MISYAYKGKYCDTLINEYENQIKDFKKILQEKDEQLLLSESLINTQRNKIEKHRKEKRFWIGATCVSTLGIVFMVIFK